MNSGAYLRYELLRTFRNRRFFVFSLGFPLVLYFVIAGPNRHVHDFASSGISAPLYYMISLSAWGTMSAMLGTGGRIAAERATGWNRQLRITPLSTRSYFRAKVVTAYATALLSLLLLYAAGLSMGVSLSGSAWLHMTGLIVVGLVPFAAFGILLGHLLSPDSVGPALGGITALLAFVSGTWFPISHHGAIHDIAQVLPSYWLVQASHVAIGGHGWGTLAWVVIVGWTAVLAGLAGRAYWRDTRRA